MLQENEMKEKKASNVGFIWVLSEEGGPMGPKSSSGWIDHL
jgi:hypothetical protein